MGPPTSQLDSHWPTPSRRRESSASSSTPMSSTSTTPTRCISLQETVRTSPEEFRLDELGSSSTISLSCENDGLNQVAAFQESVLPQDLVHSQEECSFTDSQCGAQVNENDELKNQVLSQVSAWPQPQNFMQHEATGSLTSTCENTQHVQLLCTEANPVTSHSSSPSLCMSPMNDTSFATHCENKHAPFFRFTVEKIEGMKVKLNKLAELVNRFGNGINFDLVVNDFRNDLEVMFTATSSALSDFENPAPVRSTEEDESPSEASGIKMENNTPLMQKLSFCEKCNNLEERNNWMKEALCAANLVVAQEAQKIVQLRSQLDDLKQGDEDNGRNQQTSQVNETQLALVNEKLRKMLTLVTRQQDQIGSLKQHLDSSRQENQALVVQMEKLQKILQKVETISGQKTRGQTQSNVPQEVESTFVQGQMPLLATEIESNGIEPLSADEASGSQSPSISSVSKTLTKLNSFIREKLDLEQELESAKVITSTLMNKVAEQEQKLSHVTLELSDTRNFVAKLQAAFSKLQTNESILRYELREKRRIFNALKLQLEGSRAEWKQIQQKNTVSLLEWQSLRDEFASRRKQESEESGFDEESNQGNEEIKTTEECSERSAESSTAAHPDILVDINRSSDETLEKHAHDGDKLDARGRRLKLLEDQCRLLCKKLMKSAVHCAKLDSKLTSLHDQYGSPDTERHLINPRERNTSPPENTTKENVSVLVEESSIVVEDMLGDLLNNITGMHSPELCLDPKSESVHVETMSASENNFACSEDRNHALPLSKPKSNCHKPSTAIMAHALPKRIEKLRQEKEEMQQVLRTIRKERDVQEKRENVLLAQIEELQNTHAAKHFESIAATEHLQAQLQELTSQLHEERCSKQQLQEEVEQVVYHREEQIQQMREEILQLQRENQQLQNQLLLTT